MRRLRRAAGTGTGKAGARRCQSACNTRQHRCQGTAVLTHTWNGQQQHIDTTPKPQPPTAKARAAKDLEARAAAMLRYTTDQLAQKQAGCPVPARACMRVDVCVPRLPHAAVPGDEQLERRDHVAWRTTRAPHAGKQASRAFCQSWRRWGWCLEWLCRQTQAAGCASLSPAALHKGAATPPGEHRARRTWGSRPHTHRLKSGGVCASRRHAGECAAA